MSAKRGKVGNISYPQRPWSKALMKSPILMWRLGFGSAVGQVFMILTTTGRKSQEPRRVALEYRTTEAGQVYVFSAWGEEAHWYKNIMADPYVTIQTADGTESVKARRVLEDAELETVFQLYAKNPILRQWMMSLGLSVDVQSFLANKAYFHVLTFDPTDEPTPVMLDQDLAWVPPMVVSAGGALIQLNRRRRLKKKS